MNSKFERFCLWLAPTMARMCGILSDEESEMIKKEAEESQAERLAHWEGIDRKAEAQVRTRNLCILTAGVMQAMTTAGLYSVEMGDVAIETAVYLLAKIERGTEPEEEAQS